MSHLKSLSGFLLILLCVASISLANVMSQQQQQQQQAGANSSSLPALSERANGLNSRYLSASSTASLAAATVAAANQSPTQSNQQNLQQPSNNNNNNLPTNNNQIALAHQQAAQSNHHQGQQQQQHHNHHQQQQPSQVSLQQQPLAGNNLNVQSAPSGQPQQYTNIPITPQQQQQFFGPQAPTMSTTYTYNPLTSQFQPTEFAATNSGQLFQSNAPPAPLQNPFGFPPNSYGISPGQLQLQQHQNSFTRQAQRFQQQHRHPLTSFSRRNGLTRLPQQPFASQLSTIDDDSNGLFQQQQVLSNNNNYGSLNLDQFNLHDSQSGGISYLVGQQHQQQHQNEQQIGASSPVIFPTPTTTFGPAFGASSSQPTQGSSSASSSSADQCVAADGRHGTCYQASECIKRGGVPMGKCNSATGGLAGSQAAGASGNFQSSSSAGALQDQFGGGGGGSSHVCCLFDITCGQFAAERFVYFRNPNYPATFDQSRMCRAKIGKLDKGVCQFRLDLLRFDVAKPTNGNCSSDMFVVSGQNENYVIPKICGFNDGQHYYVGVDESGVITLHMMMMGLSYRRSFEILITQIPCRSDYAAPAHCLQYFMGTHGTIKSFNYDDGADTDANLLNPSNQLANYDLQQDGSSSLTNGNLNAGGPPYGLQFNPNQQQHQHQHQQQQQQLQQRQGTVFAGGSRLAPFGGANGDHFGGYPNDLDYTICIRKESGFCSITYQLSRTELGLSPFGVGQFGLAANDNSAGWHQQQVSTECRDDYLLIGGVRLCSGSGAAGPFGSQLEGQIYGQNNQTTGQQQQQLLQLQNQQNLLMQQLARLLQQQAGSLANGTATANLAGQSNNSNSIGLQQTGSNINANSNNLDQQQAAIVQQLLLIQQQMSAFPAGNNRPFNGFDGSNGLAGQQQQFGSIGPNEQSLGQNSNLQGTIITDTTSGPFLLRFVSNMARNARGFHIDYRQNPCK